MIIVLDEHYTYKDILTPIKSIYSLVKAKNLVQEINQYFKPQGGIQVMQDWSLSFILIK